MTRVFLIAVFLCASFFIGGARAASFTPGESSTQNSIGDVVGPNKSGGSTSGGGGSSAAPPDSSRVFLQGRLSNTLGGSGGANGSLLGQVTGFFDGLPTELQSIFLQALDGGSTSDILKTLADFALLQTIYNNIENISCEGQFSSAEYSAYMRNHFLANFKLSDLSSVTSSPTEYFTGIAQKMCESAGAGQATVDPAILSGGGTPPGVPDQPAPDQDPPPPPPPGTLASTESRCETQWAKHVSNLPAAFRNNTGNLLEEIRRGAHELGMDPNTLAGIIYKESNGDKNIVTGGYAGGPHIFDANGKATGQCRKSDGTVITCTATGLIQFIKKTAYGLGVPDQGSNAAYIQYMQGLSTSQQMDLVVKYFRGAGYKPGMTELQAYATVHAGNPNKIAGDSVSGQSTDFIFSAPKNGVLSKIEAFRCGGFDWNELAWVAS